VVYLSRLHIIQPKGDHAGHSILTEDNQPTKIQIVGDDYPSFAPSLLDNFLIRQSSRK
jgi:hypothetical protein